MGEKLFNAGDFYGAHDHFEARAGAGENKARREHDKYLIVTYSPWAIYYKNEPSGIYSTTRGRSTSSQTYYLS